MSNLETDEAKKLNKLLDGQGNIIPTIEVPTLVANNVMVDPKTSRATEYSGAKVVNLTVINE